jgi:hypothetical protein
MGALVGFIIQFCNNTFERVAHYSAMLAFIQKASEPVKLTLSFFKQTQPGTNHFANGAIAAIFNLCGYKLIKVGAKGNAGISSHGVPPIPNIGTFCQNTHNKARQADAKKRHGCLRR